MTDRVQTPGAFLAPVVVEAAVDRFCGHPFDRNPYCPDHAVAEWHAWAWAWTYAGILLDAYGQEAARFWLEEAPS